MSLTRAAAMRNEVRITERGPEGRLYSPSEARKRLTPFNRVHAAVGSRLVSLPPSPK